jgi:hypothetical protein
VVKKKWTILPRHHVGDIGKQLTMEQQQLFTPKGTTDTFDALATLKSSQHFGEFRQWKRGQFSTQTMEHSPCRISWQLARSPVSMATLCIELGDSLPRSVSLSFAVGFGAWGYCRGDLTSLTMSGKLTMLADERRTNGCIKPCCEAIKKSPTAVVNSAENWTHWHASDDGEL